MMLSHQALLFGADPGTRSRAGRRSMPIPAPYWFACAFRSNQAYPPGETFVGRH